MPDFVCEGILADDGLVVLHRKARDVRNQLRGPRQKLRVDAGLKRHRVAAHFERHDDLFQRRIAGPFADAVDGAFDLACAAQNAGQRIGDGQAQIVVAVGREDDFLAARHAFAQHPDELQIFLRRRIADGVGDIDRRGAGSDRQLHAAAQEIGLRARRVFRAPLHIVREIARSRHRGAHRVEHGIGPHLQLVLHMNRAGGDEGVDAKALRRLQRFAGAIDILEARTCETADHRVLRALGDFVDRFEIAVRGNRKTCFDHIDAHRIEQFGNFEFFLKRHRSARRLFAVAQCGVEDFYPFESI